MDEDRCFQSITPILQAGANSMRAEVLLMAFADDVVTPSAAGTHVIKGEIDESLAASLGAQPCSGRLVAFRQRAPEPAR